MLSLSQGLEWYDAQGFGFRDSWYRTCGSLGLEHAFAERISLHVMQIHHTVARRELPVHGLGFRVCTVARRELPVHGLGFMVCTVARRELPVRGLGFRVCTVARRELPVHGLSLRVYNIGCKEGFGFIAQKMHRGWLFVSWKDSHSYPGFLWCK